MRAKKKQPKTQRQPVNSRLSWHSRSKKAPARSPKRVRHYNFPIWPSQVLTISLRKFRTNKARRAKSYKQLVIGVYLLPIKEIAIRQRHVRSARVFWPRLRPRLATSMLLVVLGISGAIFFGLNIHKTTSLELVRTNNVPAPTSVGQSNSSPKALSRSEPTRLRITKLGIDTSFVAVGRKADGTMAVPSTPDVVGWYNLAPTPGELGPAIVVGHVDSVRGPAIFWRLRELQPGDMVEIDRADGKTVKFKVDTVKQFPQDNFPTQEVYGNINYAGIRLITCGGVFNSDIHRYSHNTVVYGSLMP